MDKNEYQVKLAELTELVSRKEYKKAYDLAEQIDWRRVKSLRTLSMVADIYEVNKDYENCARILKIAHDRSQVGKTVLDRLVDASLKTGDLASAKKYYKEYVEVAPKSNTRLVLKYKIAKADNRPLEEKIAILEEYKEKEFTEKWAYELATLYSRAGDRKKCVETCDDIILWFSEGRYVLKAINLKQRYESLSPSQAAYLESAKQADAEAVAEISAAAVASYNRRPADSVIDHIRQVTEKAAKDAGIAPEEDAPAPVQIDEVPVTSDEFMGGKPDLKSQLEKSIQTVFSGVKEAPKVESKPLEMEGFDVDALISETAAGFSTAAEESGSFGTGDMDKPAEAAATAAEAAADTVTEKAADAAAEVKETAAEAAEAVPEEAVQMTEDALRAKDREMAKELNKAPKPTFPSDWEVPDPEPTPEEKKSHTITLTNVGQNTVPISLEEVLKSETAEERRIRILNNAVPTKMSSDQRDVFTYFARIPGMDTQILEGITGVYEHCGEHTSSNGNLAVVGADGSGKSRLSYGLVVTMCRDMGLNSAKIARISGETMNKRDPARVVGTMAGGFLCIEKAGDMTDETVARLCDAMDFRTDCMILIIEDSRAAIRNLFRNHPEFAKKFVRTISIPIFTNDELVSFARTYCQENNCQLDELGVLALYSLISNGQSQENPMTISDVKAILDRAIEHARGSAKKGGRKGVKGKNVTTVLYEKDFAV